MTKKITQELDRWIDDHRADILADLKTYVSYGSVSRDDSEYPPFGAEVRDVLDKVLSDGEKDNFVTENIDNYIGIIEWNINEDEEDAIGIWAHLDVVPPGDDADWKYPPYEAVIDGEWLYGRGVSDNKNSAVGALYILKGLRELGYKPKHNLRLFLGTNEETGMKDIDYYKTKRKFPKASLVPDAMFPGTRGEFGRLAFELISRDKLSESFIDIYGGEVVNIVPAFSEAVLKADKSDFDLKSLGEGIDLSFDADGVHVKAYGKSTHAAMPQMGINSNKILTDALLKLDNLSEKDRKILEFVSLVNEDVFGSFLGVNNEDDISGKTTSVGSVISLQDGHLHLLNDCRFCATDNTNRLAEAIISKADEYDYDVVFQSKKEPSYVEESNEIIRILKFAYEAHTGKIGANFPIGKGGTYAGKIPNAVATGMVLADFRKRPEGTPEGHGSVHQPDECPFIEGYFDGIKLFSKLLIELDAKLN